MRAPKQDFLESVVELALKEGADAAEAVLQNGRSKSVGCRNGELENVHSAESTGLTLRLFIGQRPASVSSSSIDYRSVLALVQYALSVAKVSPENPFASLASADELASQPKIDLQTCDDSEISAVEMQEMALAAETAARSVKGVTGSRGAGASYSISTSQLVTSNGFHGKHRGTSFSIGCGAIAGQGNDRESDGESSAAVYLEDLSDPASIGQTAGERAVSRLGGIRMSTGRVPVVFDRRVSNSLLGHLAGATSGMAIASRSSFLLGKLGELILPDTVNIIDDPLRIRGLQTHWFDGEGVATRRINLVENGVLKTWFLDRATAKQLNMTTNGQANRSGAGTAPGPSNLYMEAGHLTPAELIGDIKHGLYVTSLMGKGVNGITGGYSRGASGFLIENGEIATPVKGVTIAGNLLDMFCSMTPANDLKFRFGMDAPTIRLDALSIAGSSPPEEKNSNYQMSET